MTFFIVNKLKNILVKTPCHQGILPSFKNIPRGKNIDLMDSFLLNVFKQRLCF